jgi:hypothetical protein
LLNRRASHRSNLDRWGNPADLLITLILIRCGLRVSAALKLPFDCVALDSDNAALRYHKMNREALVPAQGELTQRADRLGAGRRGAAQEIAVMNPRKECRRGQSEGPPGVCRPVSAAMQSAFAGWALHGGVPTLRRITTSFPGMATSETAGSAVTLVRSDVRALKSLGLPAFSNV